MPRPSGNEIGQRGEALFIALLTKPVGRGRFLFRPQFLGDKWPNVDFIVELLGAGASTPYFFVQVKTTRNGYTKKEHNLKIQVKRESLIKLANYPAPTYIVGIDEVAETGYILSVGKRSRRELSSLPTRYALDEANRKILWQEVKAYWGNQQRGQGKSNFTL